MELTLMNRSEKWYSIQNASEVYTPALVFYHSGLKENIERLKAMIDDPLRLRPHVKTHKTREAGLMMMEAGIRKFKCATIAEAEMLGMIKAPDVLMAYQPVGPGIQRLISLQLDYPATRFSCLLDSKAIAASVSSMAEKNCLLIPVYIDLNVGMNRTGIAPDQEAIELYRYSSSLKGLRILGLHFYDGHIRERDMEQRRILCLELLSKVKALRKELTDAGYVRPQLVGGGSPSFPVYAREHDMECSPGTFILWDKGYKDSLPEQEFLTSALVLTRIVSLPDSNKVCMDLGYKSISSENDLLHRIHFLNAPDLKVISQSEEHLVAEAPAGHSWQIGDLLYVLPVHICPTVALYDNALIVQEGMITDSWQIVARKRKINI
jgi:D-threonine aldolase